MICDLGGSLLQYVYARNSICNSPVAELERRRTRSYGYLAGFYSVIIRDLVKRKTRCISIPG